MNKYSSKAVKTAATVGMSLAMVLGNVAPVVMNVAADSFCTPETEYTTDTVILNESYKVSNTLDENAVKAAINEELTKAGITVTTAAGSLQYDGSDTGTMDITDVNGKTDAKMGVKIVITKSSDFNEGSVVTLEVKPDNEYTDYTCVDVTNPGLTVANRILSKLSGTSFEETNMDDALKIKDLNGKDNITIYAAIEKYADDLEEYFNTLSYSDSSYKSVEAMLDFNKAMVTLFGEGYSTVEVDEDYKGVEGSLINEILTTTYTDADKDAADADNDDLKDAKADVQGIVSDDLSILINRAQSKLDEILDISDEDYDKELADFYDAFNKVLENDLDGEPTELNEAEQKITGYDEDVEAVKLSSKSAVKARINKIKDARDYDQFKDEDLVISLIDAYQEILDNIANITDITATDSYKAYNKTKTDDADETVKKFLYGVVVETSGSTDEKLDGKVDSEGKYSSTNGLTALKEAKAVAKVLDNEQWAVLKDLKEEVLDSVWNFETSQVGNYYRDKSAFNSYVSSTQKSVVMDNIPGFLLKVVDTETGEFGYDYLESYMEKFNAALAAVTTNIETLTPTNIKATDRETLEAAEDAIFELTSTKGDYVNNLTAKEEKTVRSAEKKIENLREAFDNLGTTTVAGWYDMGNGNWGYNNEDGTPAAYKWVASGSNWYFVRDGKMVRSSWLATDGGRWYYLDSEGKMVTNQSVDGCWINSYGVYMSPSYNG